MVGSVDDDWTDERIKGISSHPLELKF